MKKKALIIWGGWEGHHPQKTANHLKKQLESHQFIVKETSHFGILLSENLLQYDVIIPIWSCGIKSDYFLEPLLKAIKNGVGLATFHGGINWFEDENYAEMIGGMFLYDTPSERYNVTLSENTHSITQTLKPFKIVSEKYYLHVSSTNQILLDAHYGDTTAPIAWTKSYGKGRVFYTTLAHSPDQLFSESCEKLIIEGIKWCACL